MVSFGTIRGCLQSYRTEGGLRFSANELGCVVGTTAPRRASVVPERSPRHRGPHGVDAHSDRAVGEGARREIPHQCGHEAGAGEVALLPTQLLKPMIRKSGAQAVLLAEVEAGLDLLVLEHVEMVTAPWVPGDAHIVVVHQVEAVAVVLIAIAVHHPDVTGRPSHIGVGPRVQAVAHGLLQGQLHHHLGPRQLRGFGEGGHAVIDRHHHECPRASCVLEICGARRAIGLEHADRLQVDGHGGCGNAREERCGEKHSLSH